MKRSKKKWLYRDRANPKHAAHYERVAAEKKRDAEGRRLGLAKAIRRASPPKPRWAAAKKRRRAARRATRLATAPT